MIFVCIIFCRYYIAYLSYVFDIVDYVGLLNITQFDFLPMLET